MSERKETRKTARLESAGWKNVTVQGFLGLSDDDMAIIEVNVALRSLEKGAPSKAKPSRAPRMTHA